MSEEAGQTASSPNAGSYLARVLALAKPEWRTLLVGTLFLTLGSGMGLVFPKLIGQLVDGALKPGGGGAPAINQATLLMTLVFLVQGVAIALRSYLFTVAGERIVANLRKRLYGSVISQDIGFFDKNKTGELINRLSADTTVLQNTVSVNVSMALRYGATAFGGIILLLFTSAKLTGLMLLIVPAVALGAVFVGRKIRALSRKTQDALADANQIAEETLSGVRTVRVFTQESQETERYGGAVQRSFELARTRSKLGAAFSGIVSFAAYAAIAIVLWYGGHMVLSKGMSIGDLTTFLLYTLLVAFSLGALGGLWADFMRATGAAERVFDLMERMPEIPLSEGKSLDEPKGEIQFDDVTFAYPTRTDINVLDEVSFHIQPGEIVALVGPSGSGKSTIASLLSRLYDPQKGAISLDGEALTNLNANWLRQQIGVVSQEPILFSTSIADNLLYGRTGASKEEMENAAKTANAHNFIMDFPEGYQTEVGERGIQLSGGQKQRVAIARAILKNPRILLLDEATSALDTESEALVKEALDRLMKGRTTLIIAHRLSTVRDADRVLVLDNHKVVEQGTHDELLELNGIYRRLVEKQFAA